MYSEVNESAKDLWHYIAAADRETMVSGTLAWLLDVRGSHGMGDRLRCSVCRWLGLDDIDAGELEIDVEAREKGRRFDLALSRAGKWVAVLEVKTKTTGSAKQLRAYEKRTNRVARVGFGEWNYFGLTEAERQEFPLITFDQICETIDEVVGEVETPWATFLRSFTDYLREELGLFEDIRGYFIEERGDASPRPPTVHRYGERFLQLVYWHWIRERWQENHATSWKWDIGHDQSGVWMSSWPQPIDVPDGGALWVPGTDVSVPGPFAYLVKIEIRNRTSLLADPESDVGELTVHIGKGVLDADGRDRVYGAVRSARTELRGAGWSVRTNRPGAGSGFFLVRRRLAVKDLQISLLAQLVEPLLRPGWK